MENEPTRRQKISIALSLTSIFLNVLWISLAFSYCGGSSGTNSNPQPAPSPNGDNSTFTCAKGQDATWPILCTHAVDIPFDGARNVNNYILTTPNGITVRSVVPVPPEALAAIDQAFQRVIDDTHTVFPAWSSYRQPGENQVVLVDPDHYSVEADPGAGLMNVYYTVAGNQSEPVRGHVSSADTCYNCPGFFFPKVIPGIYLMAVVNHQANVDPAHPSDTPWSHLRFFREAVHNSFEHVEECGNAITSVCLQFASAGDQHPHWGDDMWSDPLPTVTASAKKRSAAKALPCTKDGHCAPLKTK